MKVAIAGKGGSGKTTIAGTLSRLMARQGHRVLALDADTNPMLGISLGVGPEKTDTLIAARQGVDSGETEHQPTVAAMIETFGTDGPDGVRLVVATRIEKNDPGCPCCGVSPEMMIRQFEGEGVVIADLEAGVGTLSRLPENGVDRLIVITEPTAKSVEVARVVGELAAERHPQMQVMVVANRVRDQADLSLIEEALGTVDLTIPEDGSVTSADRRGLAPVDVDPGSPAVAAIAVLADELGSQVAVPA